MKPDRRELLRAAILGVPTLGVSGLAGAPPASPSRPSRHLRAALARPVHTLGLDADRGIVDPEVEFGEDVCWRGRLEVVYGFSGLDLDEQVGLLERQFGDLVEDEPGERVLRIVERLDQGVTGMLPWCCPVASALDGPWYPGLLLLRELGPAMREDLGLRRQEFAQGPGTTTVRALLEGPCEPLNSVLRERGLRIEVQEDGAPDWL